MFKQYIIIFFIVGGLFACQQPTEEGGVKETDSTESAGNSEKPAVIETSPEYEDSGSGLRHYDYQEFKDCYRDFFIAILENNESRFNNFINPKSGLYILDSDGAMPKITNVEDISNYHRANGKAILSVGKENIGFELIEEDLPEVDCDQPSGYEFTGCYTANTNRLITTEIWKHVELSEKDQTDFVSLAETVVKTVVNTANYTYYFSYIDGSWYLTFLDVRKPCQA